jgi:ubiquinone/menaquinone biosynthesis C-methylase UbiE
MPTGNLASIQISIDSLSHNDLLTTRRADMRFLRPVIAAAILSLLPLSAMAQTSAQKPPRYETRAEHDPDGTGVFYMGREMAQVMGHEGADWLDRPEREAEEAPSLLIKALKLRPGNVVADIGAGSGYLSFKMARYVAPTGKVYAEDIQPEMLDIVRKKSADLGIKNVVPWLGTITETKLPDSSVDLIILVDVYHEFDHPYEMTQSMIKALKTGGRLVFVEYRKEDPNVPIKLVHKMTENQVKREMSIFPLKWVETNRILPRQHIIIFQKTPVSAH